MATTRLVRRGLSTSLKHAPPSVVNGFALADRVSKLSLETAPTATVDLQKAMSTTTAEEPETKEVWTSMDVSVMKSAKQATEEQLKEWLRGPCGLRDDVAGEYAKTLAQDGFDSAATMSMLTVSDLERRRVRTGHALTMLARADDLFNQFDDDDDDLDDATSSAKKTKVPQLRVFDYEMIKANLSVADAIEQVEKAFGKLAEGKVDVPMPMHIGIDETENYGPGDVHIKGGYVSGEPTFTVKLACVSFYKNLAKGLSPGAGVFVVMCAETGAPLGIFKENRYLTDLRTGAAGALSIKYCAADVENPSVAFIGCGAIARNMARAAKAVLPEFQGVAFAPDDSASSFSQDMSEELGVPFEAVPTAHEACRRADIVFTQTPGGKVVLERRWLRPHATVIASGSDQPTKQELPVDLLENCKYVADLTKQTSKVGELRSAIEAGAMSETDVYAELGQIINGDKPGRDTHDEIVVVDLTGTGAQDAAVGNLAWEKLSKL